MCHPFPGVLACRGEKPTDGTRRDSVQRKDLYQRRRTSYVQALAIRGERIAATGESAKIRTLAGPNTMEIDLGGRTVIPGINDAHNHLGVSPPNRIDLELKTPDPAWPEMKAAIAAAVLKAPKGTFIYGDIGGNIFHDIDVNRDSLAGCGKRDAAT